MVEVAGHKIGASKWNGSADRISGRHWFLYVGSNGVVPPSLDTESRIMTHSPRELGQRIRVRRQAIELE
jgi:hypothetical protein